MKANLFLFGLGVAAAGVGLVNSDVFAINASSIDAGERPAYTTPVGAAAVDSGRLQPYLARWTSRSPDENGEWVVTGSFEESLETDEQGHWRHRQIRRRIDPEIVVTATRTLDRETLRPLRFERHAENAPPGVPVSVMAAYGSGGYTSEATAADGTLTSHERDLDLPMFDGSIVGLVIATLPLEEAYYASLPTVIPSLKATYWLEARVIGKKAFTAADGSEVETWEVNAEWFNIDDRDIYPGGRDRSGGAYYIAVKPGAGVPFVVEYANENVVITWDGERRSRP